jgi:hypothetical protein
MNLDRVTITGADDSVAPASLLPLTRRYPFVEWGILFSGSRQGTPRYPSATWLGALADHAFSNEMDLSAHLCGRWVRDLVLHGDLTFKDEYNSLWPIFQRLQLNFHGQFHKAVLGFRQQLSLCRDKEFILQHDGVNDETILTLGAALPVVPLFDRSGGAGIVPKDWPKPIWKYQGYAGGLGPENIEAEIHRIGEAAGGSRIWIDMETKVRSADDTKFDLEKVETCLRLAEPFVSKG